MIFLVVATLLLGASVASADEVWQGDRIVSEPLTISRQTLRVAPGSRIAFKGEGRLTVEDGDFIAERAIFEARTTLTNHFRINVQNGKLTLSHCTFRGLKTETPDKRSFVFGFLRCQFGEGSRITDNTFVNCGALMMLSSSHVEWMRNLIVRGENAFATLDCTNCRMEGNEFFDTVYGLNLNKARFFEVFQNRFTDCQTGLFLYHCRESRLFGNAFFGCKDGMELRGEESDNAFVGNRFENTGAPFSLRGGFSVERNVFRDNDGCGDGK